MDLKKNIKPIFYDNLQQSMPFCTDKLIMTLNDSIHNFWLVENHTLHFGEQQLLAQSILKYELINLFIFV